MPAMMRVVQMEPGPMPTLTALAPASMRASVAVPRDELHVRERLAKHADRLQHAFAVAVRRIDDENIGFRRKKRFRPFYHVGGDADSRRYEETALIFSISLIVMSPFR